MKIMAPAGDMERFDAAITAGADEVYMGYVGYGARRFAKNFTLEQFCEALRKAHRANVSIHLTFNTLLSDAELDASFPFLNQLYNEGLDEVIVQDFGVAAWLRANFPDLPLCASTQMSITSAQELNFLQSLGFKRAVLARELTFEEIKALRAATSMELEVFASGALCISCSGKCYLSSFIGGRSGNRGMCAQPCRQFYKSLTPQGPAAIEQEEYGYFLSPKDQLLSRQEIKRFLDARVDSIKLEGRMKAPGYVYAVVRYYRDLIDSLENIDPSQRQARLCDNDEDAADQTQFAWQNIAREPVEERRRDQIAALFNRGYDKGYFYQEDPKFINEFYASNFGVEVGRVQRGAVRLSQPLCNGDGVVFLDQTARKLSGFNVSGVNWIDPTNARRTRRVDHAQPNDLVQFDEPIPPGATVLYRTYDHRLQKFIERRLKQARRYEPLRATLRAKVGRPLELTLVANGVRVKQTSDQKLEQAQKSRVTRESLQESLNRFGQTDFYLARVDLDFDPDVFVPKSLLNQLRQIAVAKLEEKILAGRRRKPLYDNIQEPNYRAVQASAQRSLNPFSGDATLYLAATVRTPEQLQVCQDFGVKVVYAPTEPVWFDQRAHAAPLKALQPLAGSLAEALLYQTQGRAYACDWTFNVANAQATRLLADCFSLAHTIYLSPEISADAIRALMDNLGDYLWQRKLTLALPVYGRLPAMTTTKTLFPIDRVTLVNAEDKRLYVEPRQARYSQRLYALGDDKNDSFTGSALYLQEPLNLLPILQEILKSGIGQVRLDFTTEDAETTRELLMVAAGRTIAPGMKTVAFGYNGGGIF
ncbi:MAG: U32 family peptidase [Planctomycetia bacterium]|nr:U32 family peptidase [Planctomycetia bacterium]